MKSNSTNLNSHRHEATLFINPSKRQIVRKKSKPKIIFSFLIVVILFMSFITYSAIANINDTGWEVWNDDDYEYTYIDKFGDIAKADLMALTLKHDDCDTLQADFYITSFDREIIENGRKFNLEITETPYEGESWEEYKNEVYIKYSELHNDKIVYILSFDHEWETQDWINRLDKFGPLYFYIELFEHTEEQLDPSLYFEHTANIWDLGDLKKILINEYRNCRFKLHRKGTV